MSRWLRGALAVALALGVLGAARADIVYYHDRAAKKVQEHRGTIEEESPAGIKIRLKDGKTEQVPAAAVSRVIYDDKDVSALDFRLPSGKEDRARGESRPKQRAALLAEALEGYLKLERALSGNAKARRYMQFKIAEVTALQAQDDPAKADAAVKLLSDFKTNHPGGWEVMPALKALAKLLEDSGRTDDARKAYEELADLPDVPAQVKQESRVLVGRLFLRAGKYAEAEKALRKLAAGMSREDPQAAFVKAYLAASEIGQDKLARAAKDLGEVIQGTGDARLRGLAYNLLGDFYQKKGQPEEAFWQYLRVDALYNEDPEEQAKALYHLAKLFDKVKKDPIRGKECAARLLGNRFAGTRYQRLLAEEGKKPGG